MAHEIDKSNNRANITYANKTPWHGLGTKREPGDNLDIWYKEAGFDFEYKKAPVKFFPDQTQGELSIPPTFNNKNVVYRSDTSAPLSIVSDRFELVQPHKILYFFEDLIDKNEYTMEVAGCLKGGARIWALARAKESLNIGGVDLLLPYLLLATSVDTSMATTAKYTMVRVVCNNTMEMCINNNEATIKINHDKAFDANEVKADLGLRDLTTFEDQVNAMTRRPLKNFEAKRAIIEIFGDPEAPLAEQPNERAMKKVYELFEGKGQGSTLATAENTAWGLVNATTEYIDHHRQARSDDNRLNSAWFGQGASTKRKAAKVCLELAA